MLIDGLTSFKSTVAQRIPRLSSIEFFSVETARERTRVNQEIEHHFRCQSVNLFFVVREEISHLNSEKEMGQILKEKIQKKRIWKFKAAIERTHDGINWWTPAVRIFFLITAPFGFFGEQLKGEGSKNKKNAKWTNVDLVVVIIDHEIAIVCAAEILCPNYFKYFFFPLFEIIYLFICFFARKSLPFSRLEQNQITEIPAKAFAAYKKLKRV